MFVGKIVGMVFTRVITIEGAGSDGHRACAAWISTARHGGTQQRWHTRAEEARGAGPAAAAAAAADRGSPAWPWQRRGAGEVIHSHGTAPLASRPGPGLPDQYRHLVASRHPPARPPRRFTTIWQLQNKPASWLSDWLPSPPPPPAPPQQRLCSSLSVIPTVAWPQWMSKQGFMV